MPALHVQSTQCVCSHQHIELALRQPWQCPGRPHHTIRGMSKADSQWAEAASHKAQCYKSNFWDSMPAPPAPAPTFRTAHYDPVSRPICVFLFLLAIGDRGFVGAGVTVCKLSLLRANWDTPALEQVQILAPCLICAHRAEHLHKSAYKGVRGAALPPTAATWSGSGDGS